jgi:hypothetical protein
MRERLVTAGNGSLTVLAGERALHSRYDPAGEAERYIKSLSIPPEVRFFILLEPGLGYLIPAIHGQFPAAKIAALHASDFFISMGCPLPAGADAVHHWAPGGTVSLQEFLEREIPDAPASQVRLVEWRPAQAVYGEAYLRLLRESADFLKRIDANVRTVRGFGRRWFKNCLRNLGILKRVLRLTPDMAPRSEPWIITGAGPSLEAAAPLIRDLAERRGARILAASSSVPALAAAGLWPDMVISTDGGGWALFHLYESFRLAGKPLPALAAGLWAALPSQCGDMTALPLSDGSLWQRLLLEGAGLRRVSPGPEGGTYAAFPQRGTVTASALDAALAMTRGPVFFAGLDLGHRDIRTHARPYALDRFQEERVSRFAPRYSQAFVRAGMISASGSHEIYAAWFKRQLAEYPRRVFPLGENNPVFGDLPAGRADMAITEGGMGCQGVWTLDEGAAERAAGALMAALNQPEYAGVLVEELGPLLLPEGEAALPAALAAAIKKIWGPP